MALQRVYGPYARLLRGLKGPEHDFYGKYTLLGFVSLGFQIAQSRPYLSIVGPKVGIIYIHGAPKYRTWNTAPI